MNHKQFIENHLVSLSDRDDKPIKEIIRDALISYDQNTYSSIDDLIHEAETNIKIWVAVRGGTTSKELSEQLNVCQQTARKKLKSMDNVVCIKTKRPYIYTTK